MTYEQSSPRPFWWLVEESASEASFLWTRLHDALDSHQYTLAEVSTWIEERLLGALDGVQVAGASAIAPLLAPALGDTDAGAVSAAVFVLCRLRQTVAARTLEQGLREVSGDLVEAFAYGLGRAGDVEALHALWTRLADASPCARAAVLRALAFCGEAPEADWGALLHDQEPQLRLAAAFALRFVSPRRLHELVDHGFVSADPRVRNRALQSGVAAGDGLAWQRSVALVSAPDAHTGPLLPVVAMLGKESHHPLLLRALERPELARDALWALGFAGSLDAADACLAYLVSGSHAQVAAEAFCAITGLDLAKEGLVVAPVEEDDEDADSAHEDDALHEELVPEADRDLPIPHVEGVQRWWERNRARFSRGVRYLDGSAVTVARLREALVQGPTRRRHPLALELAARSAGAVVIEPYAFTGVQRAQMHALSAPTEGVLSSGARALGIAPLAVA